MKKYSFLVSIIILLSSCASTYKPYLPERLTYAETITDRGITYSISSDVLVKTRNRKYSKKAARKSVEMLGVQVTNNTGRAIILAQDILITSDGQSLDPLQPEEVQKLIKQHAGLYMLWGLLWINFTRCAGYNCNTTPIPIGLAIGIANLSIASKANKNLLAHLREENILNVEIANGETVHGIISVKGPLPGPVKLQLK